MINVNTLLLMFTNPRCFHTDLEEIKSKLSTVLNALDPDAAETKKVGFTPNVAFVIPSVWFGQKILSRLTVCRSRLSSTRG